MSELLVLYPPELCGPDGYPFAWHGRSAANAVGSGPSHPAIKDLIREQAGNRCLRCGHPYRVGEEGDGQWSRCDERCKHGGIFTFDGHERKFFQSWQYPVIGDWISAHPTVDVRAEWRILTVHHLDEDKANCRWWNLAALCQRCHLRMQRAVVMNRPYHYDHTEWFRPFAAGFYAWKYLGEDLDREETMSRIDELLALEYRFTQETLL